MENQEISIKFSNKINGDKQIKDYEKKLQSIYSLLSGIEKSQKVLDKSVKNVKELKEETDKAGKNIDKMTDQFNTVFNLKAMSIFLKNATGFFQKLTNMTQKSVSYVENINLLEIAYQNANEEIEESSKRIEDFVDKMAGVYGLDESDLSRKLGIFKQLANAMKLPTEQAENLSELMVKMTNDIASLYNLPLDRASNALQSALAGQVRPIRSATGADITEKTLQNTVDALGLDRSISQLSYVEKRLVMVISLTEQLKKSQGDYGRTIESASNQIRIMKEQWERLSRAVGNVFYPILERVLPYLNAILMVLTEIFTLIASLLGFKMPKFDYSGLSAMGDATLDLIDGMNEAGASADNLKEKLSGLRSFDKLNVINTPSSSGASVGAGAGIDPKIMDAFNNSFSKYNDMMDQINMKAVKIRDAILDWLGFTDGSYKNLKLIGGILATIVGYKLITGISGLITGTSKLGKILGTGGLYKTIKDLFTLIKKGKLGDVVAGKIANIIIRVNRLLTFLNKFKVQIAGIALVLSGSKGLNKQFKELDTSMGKTAVNVTKLVGGGALIGSAFGPLGAIIGGLAGGFLAFGQSIYNSNKQLDELTKKQIFGTLNVSTQQWLDILGQSGPQIENLGAKFEALQSDLSNTYQSFLTNSDAIDLYGVKVSLLGEKISTEDSQNFIDAINNMATEATDIITKSGDFNLQTLNSIFSGADGVVDEEEKSILNKVLSANEQRKKSIAEAQTNITTTYDNAIKTRGYLTDQEYIYIQEQLNKIRELTQTEMTKNQTDIEYFKRISADKNLILDEKSYENFNKALDSYYDEKMGIISTNYNVERNALEQALNELDETDTEGRNAIFNKMTELDTKRKKQETEVNKYVEDARKTVYANLANQYSKLSNKTDDDSRRQKKAIENIFKNINIDSTEIVNKFSTIGTQCANSFNSSLKSGISGNIQLQGTSFNAPISLHANGGLPPVGQLFIANEKGPELVGQIGGQSFVANQNQMMDLLDRKLGSNSRPINVTIPVEVGGEHLATIVINDLQDMATTNGKPIVIGG